MKKSKWIALIALMFLVLMPFIFGFSIGQLLVILVNAICISVLIGTMKDDNYGL